MPAAMSQESLAEYIPRVRNRYERMREKRARSRVLDEFCAVSGWERKYALKVLRGQRRDGRAPGRGGAPRRYEEAVVEVLTYCWRQMEQPCGKRMLGMLPLWFAAGSGAVARRILGSTVIGGMIAASGIAIFLIPVTFYVVERLSSRGHVTAQAPQPKPEATPAAALPS